MKTAESNDNAVKPQCDYETLAKPSAATTAIAMPTYHSTKQSKAYTLSKQLLSSGSLDDALTTLEMALQLSREMLAQNHHENSLLAAAKDDDVNIELHESLAPLYYLYGTTLLYSVEESDVMMAANGKQQQNDVVEDVEVPQEADEENEEANNFDQTEDIQIAWENLDLSRNIVSRLVGTFHNQSDENTIVLKSNHDNDDTSCSYTPTQQTTLLLDLAQIHTRLGDLQRANANVLPCIDDYNLALQLRLSHHGKFDRKVADSHFSLGQVYAEAPNKVEEVEGKVKQFVSSLGPAPAVAGDGENQQQQELSEGEKEEFRRLSLEHYLACGVAFAGIMARMCGEDADKLTTVDDGNEGSTAQASSSTESSNHHSKTMATLRQRLTTLQPTLPNTASDNDIKEEFNDLKEMLVEIQEAIDTAEETEEGLKSLGEMKANEIKKHEMKNGGDNEDNNSMLGEGGITTTIGFGANSSNSFGGAGTAMPTTTASAAVAPTMMIVKKKKKKSLQAAKEESAKRLKTN